MIHVNECGIKVMAHCVKKMKLQKIEELWRPKCRWFYKSMEWPLTDKSELTQRPRTITSDNEYNSVDEGNGEYDERRVVRIDDDVF